MDICFAEQTKIVPVAVPKDHSASSLTEEYINMKNAHRATWILQCGAIATGGALTLVVGNDASGTKNATSKSSMDVTLDHYWITGGTIGSSSADVYTKTTVSSSTFNVTGDSKTYIVEVEASKLGQFSSSSVTYDADYIKLAVVAGGSDYMSCVCILTGYRYQEDSPPTAIA